MSRFIQVEVILPSQARSSLSLNVDYIVSFVCSQGVFTEVVMTRGMYVVDMCYDDFMKLVESRQNDV